MSDQEKTPENSPPVTDSDALEKPPQKLDPAAEKAYFAALQKDDTLVKKPKTLPFIEMPDVKATVRWGNVFLGKSARLALRIKGRPEPIRIEVESRFVIGRSHSQSTIMPDLDLAKYGAFFHGVSRQHVAILKDGDVLQIEDLNSTNGTFLNGRKMPPNQPRMLRDGDELCLGHLILVVNYILSETDKLP